MQHEMLASNSWMATRSSKNSRALASNPSAQCATAGDKGRVYFGSLTGQYSLGRGKAVEERSASVMIQTVTSGAIT